MPLPSSGTLSIGDIRDEFDVRYELSNPVSLSEFYNKHTEIVNSGKISVSDFYNVGVGYLEPGFTHNYHFRNAYDANFSSITSKTDVVLAVTEIIGGG